MALYELKKDPAFELPSTTDPCGENGEFHSFVYGGPIFRNKVAHVRGAITLRNDRFWYFDLIPVR